MNSNNDENNYSDEPQSTITSQDDTLYEIPINLTDIPDDNVDNDLDDNINDNVDNDIENDIDNDIENDIDDNVDNIRVNVIQDLFKKIHKITYDYSERYIMPHVRPVIGPYYDQTRCIVYDSTIGYLYTRNIMREVIHRLSNNSIILDVGIGTGCAYVYNADLIKEKNLNIVGIDKDQVNLKRAQQTIDNENLSDNIKLVLGDVYTTAEIEEKFFDYVLFSDSYAIIPDVHKILGHCEKFAKPDGKMIIVSTLFDEYSSAIDWVKSHIDFGSMMLKSDLEKYLNGDRKLDIEKDVKFNVVEKIDVPFIKEPLKTYMVQWNVGVSQI